MNYVRPGRIGMTRIWASRGRRRMLAVLLTGAENLHAERIGSAASVGSGSVYPFLADLVAAGWADREKRRVGSQQMWCYSLTPRGRVVAAAELNLVMPQSAEPQGADPGARH